MSMTTITTMILPSSLQYSASPNQPKNAPTKAQIHSINALEEDFTVTEETEIKYAVILHNCKAAKEEEG